MNIQQKVPFGGNYKRDCEGGGRGLCSAMQLCAGINAAGNVILPKIRVAHESGDLEPGIVSHGYNN